MNELIQTLADLVAIDSTSTRSNLPVVDYLERRLTAAGYRCERHGYRDQRGVEKANLVALSSSGPIELALVGHTDCVPFDASWTEALKLTERESKLYGRGACDTKAFVACALLAAERVRAKVSTGLALCFTADEEVGCVGAKQLADSKRFAPKRAIIGEPTSLQPIRANKGYCLADVELTGKEGHSAYPESGANAIFHASRLISKLEQYARGPLRQDTDAHFAPPYTTVNVGVIEGGKAKNIIAGRCRFTLEWRPIPQQAVGLVLREVEGIRDACLRDDPSFQCEIRPLRMDRGFDTPADADLVRFLERATGQAAGTVSFGTEGPQLAETGCVPVVLGPGNIQVAHQTGEFVPVAELNRCAEILEQAALHFAGGV